MALLRVQQKERRKLDLLRVDYDWARSGKGKKVVRNA